MECSHLEQYRQKKKDQQDTTDAGPLASEDNGPPCARKKNAKGKAVAEPEDGLAEGSAEWQEEEEESQLGRMRQVQGEQMLEEDTDKQDEEEEEEELDEDDWRRDQGLDVDAAEEFDEDLDDGTME